mgnify:CR=1 FL=1
MTQDTRFTQLTSWIHSLPSWELAVIDPASADASFRRYFRATLPQQTAIVMDCPPDKLSVNPFLDMTERLHEAGVLLQQTAAPDMYNLSLLVSLPI